MLEKEVLDYLNRQYNPSLIILYGSYHTKTINTESDIDLILIAPVKEFLHDSSLIDGKLLDAWVYPEKESIDIENIIHILPCKIVKDVNSIGISLIEEIRLIREHKTKKLNDAERIQLVKWIEKMLNRAKGKSIEANYRYNLLLNDLPEIYCQFRNEYYNGPIKTISKIKEEDNNIYELYLILLGSRKNIKKLKELYNLVGEKS